MTQPDLANSLANAKAEFGRSNEVLSTACDLSPSDTQLHQLINALLKNFPDSSTVRASSSETGVSVKEFLMAAAKSLDLVVPGRDPDLVHIQITRDFPSSTQAVSVALMKESVKLNSRDMSEEVVGRGLIPPR
jgi:hypothetical protein